MKTSIIITIAVCITVLNVVIMLFMIERSSGEVKEQETNVYELFGEDIKEGIPALGYNENKRAWNRIQIDEKGHVICAEEEENGILYSKRVREGK